IGHRAFVGCLAAIYSFARSTVASAFVLSMLRTFWYRIAASPYRFSFDLANGDLIQADVGQNNVEEIDRIVRAGNFGWAIKEGDFIFNRPPGFNLQHLKFSSANARADFGGAIVLVHNMNPIHG
ncbi:MAG: hypothetical protein RL616_2436, partial [Verrucomicrobiota bacterium]